MTQFWAPQQLVIDTTFCGNWSVPPPPSLRPPAADAPRRAGIPQEYAETCAGETSTTGAPATGVCYVDNVVGPGSPRFDDAYWEIAHVRAYTTGTNAPGPTALPDNAPSKVVQLPASATRVGASLALLVACSLALGAGLVL